MANERPVSKLYDAVRAAAQVVDVELPLTGFEDGDYSNPRAQDRLSLRTEAFKRILDWLLEYDWINDRDEREGLSGA
jgi:hypothetical protein